jgi:hypothetical protein
MSFRCQFLDSHLTTLHSNTGLYHYCVRFRHVYFKVSECWPITSSFVQTSCRLWNTWLVWDNWQFMIWNWNAVFVIISTLFLESYGNQIHIKVTILNISWTSVSPPQITVIHAYIEHPWVSTILINVGKCSI